MPPAELMSSLSPLVKGCIAYTAVLTAVWAVLIAVIQSLNYPQKGFALPIDPDYGPGQGADLNLNVVLSSLSFVCQVFSLAIIFTVTIMSEVLRTTGIRAAATIAGFVFSFTYLMNNFVEVYESLSTDEGTINNYYCVHQEHNKTFCSTMRYSAYMSLALLPVQILMWFYSIVQFLHYESFHDMYLHFRKDGTHLLIFLLVLLGCGGFAMWGIGSAIAYVRTLGKALEFNFILHFHVPGLIWIFAENILLYLLTPFLGVLVFLSLAVACVISYLPNKMLVQGSVAASFLCSLSFGSIAIYSIRRLNSHDAALFGLAPCKAGDGVFAFLPLDDRLCMGETIKAWGIAVIAMITFLIALVSLRMNFQNRRWVPFTHLSHEFSGSSRSHSSNGYGTSHKELYSPLI